MKVLRLVVVISGFIITSCSDSDIPNPIIINNENAVFVDENQSVYEVDDLLWLNINISTIQEDQDGTIRDIFELTKANETFAGFSLFEVDGESFTPIEFEEKDIAIEKGHLNVNDDAETANTRLLGVARYNDGIYEMRVGIPLKSIGEFFLANPELGSGNKSMVFNPTNGSDIDIQLSTKIQGSNSDGRYYITVN